MVVCRQTLCWRWNWVFYILIYRKYEVKLRPWAWLEHRWNLVNFLQQCNTTTNKVTLPNSASPYELTGAMIYKLPQVPIRGLSMLLCSCICFFELCLMLLFKFLVGIKTEFCFVFYFSPQGCQEDLLSLGMTKLLSSSSVKPFLLGKFTCF